MTKTLKDFFCFYFFFWLESISPKREEKLLSHALSGQNLAFLLHPFGGYI